MQGGFNLEGRVRRALKRIEEKSSLHAFTRVYTEEAIEKARKLQRQRDRGETLGPLAGLILAIKDNIAFRNHPLTCGSRILQHYISPFHATVVQRILNAGGIIIGHTNMDEFAMGSSSETSVFGVVRNPLHPEFVAGGSSGGSAVSVAAEMVDLALGSDTGGSVRQPAAFCGVVGMKPSYGRVSRYGLVAFASSLEQIGPLGQRVRDVAYLLEIIAGHDSRDATSVTLPVPRYTQWLNRDVRGMRMGLPREFLDQAVEGRIRQRVEEVAEELHRAGAEIVPVSLSLTRYAVATYYILASAEASSNLARFDGVRYGFRAENSADPQSMYRKTRQQGFGWEVKRRLMLGTYVLSRKNYQAFYGKARKVQKLIQQEYQRVFQQVDVLLAPTSPTFPFRPGERLQDPIKMYLSDVLTVPANLTGMGSLSLPLWGKNEPFPVGLQIISAPFREELLIQVGDFVERNLAGESPLSK